MATLSGLPAEVIDAICTYLEDADIKNCRFADKSLKDKTSHAYFGRHFGTVRFMITSASLQLLIDRAKDARFRTSVKELQLCLITFPMQGKQVIHDKPYTTAEKQEYEEIKAELLSEGVAKLAFDNQARGVNYLHPLPTLNPRMKKFHDKLRRNRRRGYSAIMHDQNTLRTRSKDVEMLAEVIRNLPALTNIVTISQYDNKNPPFGAKQLFTQLGGIQPKDAAMLVSPNSTPYYHYGFASSEEVRKHLRNYCMHSIGVVLGAILKSGCHLQGNLGLAGVPYELLFSKVPTRRRLYPTATPGRTFAASQIPKLGFSKLSQLSLSLYDYTQEDLRDISCKQPVLQWLKQFIPLMPNLKSLSITGAYVKPEEGLLHPLAAGDLHIPKLQNLELNHLMYRVEYLEAMLLNHVTTLRSLVVFECSNTLGGNVLGIIRVLHQIPQMTFVELTARQKPGYRYPIATDVLPGLGVKKFQVKESSPSDFQYVLESTYSELLRAK